MASSLITALRTVGKRIGADWLVLIAAFITISLASVLLASGPIYADAVTTGALHQTLLDAPGTESNLKIEIRVSPESYETADQVVVDTVGKAFAATGADIYRYIEAESYGLTERADHDIIDLASFRHYQSIESRTTLLDGAWPQPGNPPLETAISRATAEAAGLEIGSVFEATNRADATITKTVRVVGIYEIDDPRDPFWLADELAVRGFVESPAFRTFGPMVVSLDTMFDMLTPQRTHAGWRVLPRYESLTVAAVGETRSAAGSLADDLNTEFLLATDGDTGISSEFTVATGVTALLSEVDRSLTVTRSSVVALLVQLAVLAGYALALTAGLIVDTRRTETALLRSRGADPRQVLAISLLEGLLLTVPAVLMAPTMASALLGALGNSGPLSAAGLSIDPVPTGESYVAAALAAALAIVALAWPSYRSARASQGSPARHQRQQTRPPAQRVGLDVALVALAVLAFWQLQVLGPQLGASVRGRFGVDPLLVVTPALGLLAGSILALRVVPLMARLGERIAASGRGSITPLASWQVARRPARYARSSLLLMMAIGIGFFAASYTATWTESQADQAGHAVGADISLLPDITVNHSLPDLYLPTAHRALDGVLDSMPVEKRTGSLARSGEITQFVLIDAAKAPEIAVLRPDLAPDFDVLMETLVAGRPSVAVVDLPGTPEALALEYKAVEVTSSDDDGSGDGGPARERLVIDTVGRTRMILQDGDGILHRVPLGPIPINVGRRRMVVSLREELGDGRVATPTFPISLVNIEIESAIPEANHTIDFVVHGIYLRDETGWARVPVAMDWVTWGVSQTTSVGVATRPSIRTAPTESSGELRMTIETGEGSGAPPVNFSIRPAGTALPVTYPVVVSEAFVEAHPNLSSEIRLPPLGRTGATATIIGTVAAFPSVDEDLGETVIADLATVQMMSYEPGFGLGRLDEYWISAAAGHEPVVTALAAEPLRSRNVRSTESLTKTRVSDPVALGTTGALSVGFVAATVFAAVGFAVSATVSARERLVEFGLLRAVGLSPGQLGKWLGLEQGVLVTTSLAMGTLIGWALTAAILPLISLTQNGDPAVPEVIVSYPWGTILVLELAVVTALGVVVVVMSALLRRVGLGSLLRMGED